MVAGSAQRIRVVGRGLVGHSRNGRTEDGAAVREGNNEMPGWWEQLLGVDVTAAGEGTVWGLSHSWTWPAWVGVVFVAGAAGLIWWAYWSEAGKAGRWQRGAMAVLRMVAVGIVLFMLAGWTVTLERTGLPYAAVLVDDSASMGIADQPSSDDGRKEAKGSSGAAGAGERTRLELAKSLLLAEEGKLLRELERRYKLRVYLVGETARMQPGGAKGAIEALETAEAAGEKSRLGEGLRSVLNDLRGAPPAAIIAVTDGITTEGESLGQAAIQARRRGVPLYLVGVGSETKAKDLEVSDLLVDEVAFVGDAVNFEFTVAGAGLAGKEAEIRLLEKSAGVVASERITIAEDGKRQRVRIPYRPPKVGEYEFTVEATPVAEERRTDNNRRRQTVSVRDEKVRVLMVQGYPSYEFRYLKELLLRDKTIELRYVQQDADVEFEERDRGGERVSLPAFPPRRDDLFAYDAVILGDADPGMLGGTALSNLVDFVKEKGGGLALISGSAHMPLSYRSTPLAELIPIDLSAAALPAQGPLTEGFRLVPTETGLSKPQMQIGDSPSETAEIWGGRLSPLYWLLEAPRLKQAAQVLAEHPMRTSEEGRKLPVIVYRIAGAGKVLLHLTDDTWRWRGRVGDRYFGRYWIQAIRYLSRSKLAGNDKLARLTADRTRYRSGEPVRLQLRFMEEQAAPEDERGVTVMYERDGRTRRQIALARAADRRSVFEGELGRLEAGSYHAWVVAGATAGGPAVDFEVLAPAGETERMEMDAADLGRAARESRGRFYRWGEAGRLLSDLPAGAPVPIETLPPIPLWNRPVVLAFLLVVLITEWLLRKRAGML